jgi:hypothetical protein
MENAFLRPPIVKLRGDVLHALHVLRTFKIRVFAENIGFWDVHHVLQGEGEVNRAEP